MKDRIRIIAALAFGFAALAMPYISPAQVAEAQNQAAQHHHYKLIQMGTFGGPTSSLDKPGGPPNLPYNRVINSAGAVLGSGDTPIPDPFQLDGPQVNYNFVRQHGVHTNLEESPHNPTVCAQTPCFHY